MIPDGSVLIHRGVIQAVGASRQVLSLARASDAEEIDAAGKVIMPAFVDPSVSLGHARPSARSMDRLARYRERDDPALFQEILKDGAHACASLSSQTLKQRASRLAEGILRHGTGTVGSLAPYAFEETTALKILRAQQDQGNPLQTVSMLLLTVSQGQEAARSTDYICGELLPKVRKRRLATAIDFAFDANTLPDVHASRILRIAAQLGFLRGVHADLTARSSAVPLAIACRANFVSGFRNITPEETRLLGSASTIALFTPGATFQTGIDGELRARAMLNAGVIPALASGFHPELSPAYSMQMILLLASRLHRFTPEEAITAGTINSAHVLRLEDSVGSIETAKQADILVLNVSDYRELAYYPGLNIVDKVIKRGQVVYDAHADTTHSTLDPPNVYPTH